MSYGRRGASHIKGGVIVRVVVLRTADELAPEEKGPLITVALPASRSDTSAHISCASSSSRPKDLQPLIMPRDASCMSISSTVGGTSSSTSNTKNLRHAPVVLA